VQTHKTVVVNVFWYTPLNLIENLYVHPCHAPKSSAVKEWAIFHCKCCFLTGFLRITSQHSWIPKSHPICDLHSWSRANNLLSQV